MTCCGKTKKALNKGKNIAKGFTAVAVGKKYEFTDGRIRICRACPYNTWMTRIEYGKWLFKNGIKVLTNFDDLAKLPMLPKQKTGRNIYCRICKCDIPAKARVEDVKCPKDKWKT
jgi:hypothetical protein